ncbi:MAG TPA: oligopeptide/dipeptide ABC transporter ATP-binding protein, partial [Acidobacteriaceae bacterium]|nr:oligopeptide/dipeptide ABC transporter ATP-binding protein [Acidobacteriaceae bacterium]
DLLILDEPTTALDATVEMEVLRLIRRLTAARNIALLMISHNFRIVEQLCERVGVLYAGSLVEEGPTGQVFERPGHPYTASLLACVPGPNIVKAESRLFTISGELPRLGQHVTGCSFEPRCPVSERECAARFPPALRLTQERWVHCFFPERAEGLGRAVPPLPAPAARATSGQSAPALKTISLRKTFHHGSALLTAVDGIDLEVLRGETLGIVGETGSGKSTLAKLVLGLQRPDAGSIIELDGRSLAPAVTERTKQDLRAIGAVLQNPDTTLNPRHTIRYALDRSLAMLGTVPKSQRKAEVSAILSKVRLREEILDLYPSHLSGGMKQRVSIARALISHPTTLVCDEATSGLDVSVQAAFLNLLVELQSELDLTYVFISHDLRVVQYISDRLLVMHRGVAVELGVGPQAFRPPFHPYTELLMDSAERRSIASASSPLRQTRQDNRSSAGTGCVFHPLCPRKLGSICETQKPPVQTLPGGKQIRCHIPAGELAQLQAKTRRDDVASGLNAPAANE